MSRSLWIRLGLCTVWLTALAWPLGPLPPLGAFLSIRSGVWHHHDWVWKDAQLKGLHEPVSLALDEQNLPHLFAKNEHDLYLAQGYILASQRLFQMDLSTRLTVGRVSALVGAKGLPLDRFFTRFGVVQSTERTLKDYMSDPQTAAMIEAYVQGINLFIDQMDDLPAEYKFLNAKPEHFDPRRVIAMAKALTFSLDGGSADYILSHLRQQIGLEKVLDLFPEFLPDAFSDYILNRKWQKGLRAPETAQLFPFETHLRQFPNIPQPMAGNGSNNWVVGPKKSATGHSLLANDTHLGLTLPNIWFPMQLVVPEFNVFGVALVSVPGLVNGFSERVAWGPTNGSTDALDYYEVEFKDDVSLEYRVKSAWETAQVFPTRIEVRGGKAEVVDTLWTKWGTVLYREGHFGLVANWVGHRTKRELLALRHLYMAKTAAECVGSFQDWNVPIQNFVCADPDHIAITHAGFIPKRRVGEGRFIECATDLEHPLEEPLADALRPETRDPASGYLRSANERVVNATYPEYLGWDYEEPYRGARIRKLLEAKSTLTLDDVMAIQNDPADAQAEQVLPVLLHHLQLQELTAEQTSWFRMLERWDYQAQAQKVEPTLFNAWYKAWKKNIFEGKYSLPEAENYRPKNARLAWMLHRVSENPEDSDTQWTGDLNISVTRAFKDAWKDLEKSRGLDPAKWIWRDYLRVQARHVGRFPGFGSEVLTMDGSTYSVRGEQSEHGAVYKLAVALGNKPNAFIQIPGGLSGDPFSPSYTENLHEWAQGVMRPAHYFKSLEDAREAHAQIVTYSP